MNPTSPIGIALKTIIEAVVCDPIATSDGKWESQTVGILFYREDFGFLWRFQSDFIQWLQSGNRTLVLCWDGIPSDTELGQVNVTGFLTAIDWAMALSWRASNPNSEWQVLILDSVSDHYATALGVRLFGLLQGTTARVIPWIRTYSPLTIEGLCGALRTPCVVHGVSSELDLCRRVWTAELVNPGNSSSRHLIANLVGPSVLLGGILLNRRSYGELTIRALDSLLRSVGLMPTVDGEEDVPWTSPQIWRENVKRIVLIDDMARLGWGEFLEAVLGAENAELEVVENPLNWRSMVGRSDQVLLFLDLRLFSSGDLEAEFAFYADLITEAHKYSAEFPQSELFSAEKAILARDPEHPGYVACLTLLPKLLAIADPTLPIVTFSSTGRKEVTDALRPFPNIVTDFAKPRFFGTPPDNLLHDTRMSFERAMSRALAIASGRNRILQIRGKQEDAAVVSLRRKTGEPDSILEVYLDESGSDMVDGNIFAVGGFAVVYPRENGIARLENTLKNQFSVCWTDGRTPMHPPSSPADYHTYEQTVASTLSAIDAALRQCGATASAFALTTKIARPRSVSPFASEWRFDHLYRRMLAEVLEALLFGCFGSLIGAGASVRIHFATRTLPRDLTVDRGKMIENWGYYYLPDRRVPGAEYFFVIDSSEGRRVVHDMLLRRPGEAGRVHLDLARAVTLGNKGGGDRPTIREIHHVADWLTREARRNPRVPTIARQWFAHGFLQPRDEAFQSWLRAGRAADREEWSEALRFATDAQQNDAMFGPAMSYRFGRFLTSAARSWTVHIADRRVFGRFCGLH